MSVGAGAESRSGGAASRSAPQLNIGATVKMTNHIGALFLYTVTDMRGDDCDIRDARGRLLKNVPVEFLERVGDEPQRIEA
jgi:hypothetical protein